MLLEQTISQLDIGRIAPERALELGQLGYMQWLGALPPMADYPKAARFAYARARPFAKTSPAVMVFCDLLLASMRTPLAPLVLRLPERQRRGGARARRAAF
ncbi:MAG: hypothetical protein AAGF88_09375 [Pseudomonadota bacterium]